MKMSSENKRIFWLGLPVLYLILAFAVNRYNASLTQDLGSKCWAHRVNTFEKLEEVAPLFDGIELDVVFERGVFDIHHPPAPSSGLKLEFYFYSEVDLSDKTIWLDFKNLTNENVAQALDRLALICHDSNLKKSQFIIESDRVELLSEFSNQGFKTSYYLPSSLATEMSEMDQQEIFDWIDKYETYYLSMDIANYDLISEKYPNRKKLLWSLPYESTFTPFPIQFLRQIKQSIQKRTFLNDDSVDGILFSYELEGSR